MNTIRSGIFFATALLLWAPDLSLAQCTGTQGLITVSLDQADSGSFIYTWRIKNDDGGQGNRLTEVFFEVDTATPSSPGTTEATWTTSHPVALTDFAGSSVNWTALSFQHASGTDIFNGVEETFTYALDQFVSSVRVRTKQQNKQILDFAEFTSAGNCSLLPVELASFDAIVDDGTVSLYWSTASERNTAGFEIQYRGGEFFETIGFVEATGSSDELQRYRFDHSRTGAIYGSYRLKMVDFDGTFEYSPEVKVATSLPGGFFLSHNYPNPFNPTTQFEIAVDRSQHVAIEVFDVTGKRVATLLDGLLEDGGPQPVVFTAGSLPSGLYVVRAVGETFSSSRVITLLK